MTNPPATLPSQNPTQPTGDAGKWFGVLLGLAIALLGCLFVWLLGRSFLRAWDMRSWPEVPCVILASEIEEWRHDEFSKLEYQQNLSYGYEWAGRPMVGTKVTLRENPRTSNRALAEQRTEEFPAGKMTVCRVDPSNPQTAVLRLDSLAPGYSIWFPGLFVVGGLGIVIRIIRRR